MTCLHRVNIIYSKSIQNSRITSVLLLQETKSFLLYPHLFTHFHSETQISNASDSVFSSFKITFFALTWVSPRRSGVTWKTLWSPSDWEASRPLEMKGVECESRKFPGVDGRKKWNNHPQKSLEYADRKIHSNYRHSHFLLSSLN